MASASFILTFFMIIVLVVVFFGEVIFAKTNIINSHVKLKSRESRANQARTENSELVLHLSENVDEPRLRRAMQWRKPGQLTRHKRDIQEIIQGRPSEFYKLSL